MAVESFAEMRLPPELFGRDPRGMLGYLGYKARHLDGDRWAVKVDNLSDALVSTYSLADQSGRAHRFDLVEQVLDGSYLTLETDTLERLGRLQSRLIDRASHQDDLAALFHLVQANIAFANHRELAEAVQGAYAAIGNISREGTDEPFFPNRSAHVIRVSDVLIRRVRLPGIMFRFGQDPAVSQLITAIQAGQLSDVENVFASSSDWFHNVIAMSPYVGPLLGCITPRFWGFHSHRSLAIILVSLGSDVNGFRSAPMEPMQLLPISGPDQGTPPENLSPTSCADAIDWWVMRLNQMFRYLSDPTTFKDATGVYAPHEHHHWMLTFGEVFNLMTSLQCAGRDVRAQRALMNTLLDAFADRIMGVDFNRLCTHSYAKNKVDELREKMPASVARLLLPAAERSVAALEEAQEGFFIQRQRGDADVVLHQPDGRREERSPERAVAMLLKLFRNATHGYGSRKGARERQEIDSSLLVHHQGHLPDDIALLPYIYLLDTLCNPDRVRDSIARKVATPR